MTTARPPGATRPASRSAPTASAATRVRMGEVQGQGYIAQALGIADVLAVAYFHAMRYRPEEPTGKGATASCCPSGTTPSRSTPR